MRSRCPSKAALLGAALAALAAAPAGAQPVPPDTVLALTLPVQDLTLRTVSLDNSVGTEEFGDRVRVTLAADVLFRFDRASLSGRARSRIAEAVARIEASDPPEVRVTGHTDSRGSAAYNLGLSRRRAAAVTAALKEELGAGAPALRTEGHGEADPVAPNQKPDGSDDPRGRARNRRVTITFQR